MTNPKVIPVPVKTFQIPIVLALTPMQDEELRKMIDLHVAGKEVVTKFVDGNFVSTCSPEEDLKIKNACVNIGKSRKYTALVDIDANGTWLNVKITHGIGESK